MFVMSAGHGGDDMASGMLQDQPHHSQRTEVLHPTHVGSASDPHHSSGHSGTKMSPVARDCVISSALLQNGVTMNTLMAYSSRVSTIRKQVR